MHALLSVYEDTESSTQPSEAQEEVNARIGGRQHVHDADTVPSKKWPRQIVLGQGVPSNNW